MPTQTPARPPSPLPVVLVSACNRRLGEHPFHVAGGKYVDAVRLAGALPLVVPDIEAARIDELLDLAHGVMLTGSASNVHPARFEQPLHDASLPLDAQRDAWTLPLARRALQRGVPLLAICRGAQEVNVALGGTLYQAVHEVPGLQDHRSDDQAPAAVQYGPAHTVQVQAGGVLEGIVGACEISVNSVHGQGIDRLAPGLRAEAHAPDGLVEAFCQPDGAGFNLCVQWHPEWRAAAHVASMRILRAFGVAVRAYRDRARVPLPAPPLRDRPHPETPPSGPP